MAKKLINNSWLLVSERGKKKEKEEVSVNVVYNACLCPWMIIVLDQQLHHKWPVGSKVTHFRYVYISQSTKLHPLSNPIQLR